MATQNQERRLSKAIISLMRQKKFAFYSGALMMGSTFVDDNVPTAYTDGIHRKFGRKFIDELNDKELAFVVLHECMHDLYMHFAVWRKLFKENHKMANMACDYVINLELVKIDAQEEFIAMPKDKDGNVMGCLDYEFDGMNSKQVFDVLKKEGKKNGKNDGEGFDEHGWEEYDKLPNEEKEKVQKEIQNAIRQGVIAAKKAGVGMSNMHKELGELVEPKVDWRDVLREFVKTSVRAPDVSTWRKPNRRFLASGDIYMPSLIGETVGKLVVGVDTSGSCSGYTENFVSEVQGIARDVKPEEIDLLYWDSGVEKHENYKYGDLDTLVASTQPSGGGGTSPSCVTDWIKKHGVTPECCVMLTDGIVGDDWGGEWPCPVLWIIVGDSHRRIEAKNGKTIHVAD